jgi:elongation factor Tu
MVLRTAGIQGILGRMSDESPDAKSISDLLEAGIPTPKRDAGTPFLMPIEGVFSIADRGTVVVGRVERGRLRVGEEVEIVGLRETVRVLCTSLEMLGKRLEEAVAGDVAECGLRDIEREDVERGQVLAKIGSITPHAKFEAAVRLLKIFEGNMAQFDFWMKEVPGEVTVLEGTTMMMPGHTITVVVTLGEMVACEEGSKFEIRQGGSVGAGVVTKIIS